MTGDHITVCVCTYKRPAYLIRLMKALQEQVSDGLFTYSIVIVDNDRERSAERVVADLEGMVPVPLRYNCEPEQNIALARNMAMAHATGNFIAFSDDDEVPERNWLVSLYQACRKFRADGVLGPVLPLYEVEPPSWVVRGKFYERPSHATGEELTWKNTRTGNVLFRRALLLEGEDWFRPEFGSGGEDRDFFKRMIARGHRFVWCAEAPVREVVPAERCTWSFMVRRAFLRGQLPHFKGNDLLKSLVAVPVYSALLPVLLLCGRHLFMKFLIKNCDHIGRIFAFLGMPLIREKYVVR